MNPPLTHCRRGLRWPVWLLLAFTFLHVGTPAGAQSSLTVPAGSYIIDMGANANQKPAGLRPYGMVHELVKWYKVPVIWVVRQGKNKDATDYTIEGRAYRSGIFIVPAPFITVAVQAAITGWTTGTPAGTNGYTRGLVTARALAANAVLKGAISDTIRSFPLWTLDAQNGNIFKDIFSQAGIPSSAYNWLAPSQLGICNDVFVLPHADPQWVTHGNLLTWNLQSKGAIWMGCHAGSALENMYNPANTAQQTNFLTTKASTPGTNITLPVAQSTNYAQNSLFLWGNHADPQVPFTTNSSIPVPQTGTPAGPDDWVSQFIGFSDDAHTNGSEQAYLPVPGQGWRSTTKIISFDPDHKQVPPVSPGAAAVMAYGRAFGESARGQVMLEAGHNINGGNSGDVAAQRAFFNWSFHVVKDKAIRVNPISGVPLAGNITVAAPPVLSVSAQSAIQNGVALTYSWSCVRKSDGLPVGSFSPNNSTSAATTTFLPGATLPVADLVFNVTVTDPCGRSSASGQAGASYPIPANDAAAISSSCLASGASALVNVLANDTDPDFDINTASVQLQDPSNPAIFGSSFTVPGKGTWSTNGTTVSFVPVTNSFGLVSINYRVCDNTPGTPLCATATVTVDVGSADANGCYAGSVYGVSTSTTATGASGANANAASSLGGPDYDNTSPATISATAATVSTTPLVLDFGSQVTARDTIHVYFASATDGSSVTLGLEYATAAAPTTWIALAGKGGTHVTDAYDGSDAYFDFPTSGLRYLRLSRSAGTPAMYIDAAVLEDWSCVSAQLLANNDNVFEREDIPVIIDVLGNDENPGNQGLSLSITQQPARGLVSINTDNTITYLNNRDYSGTDLFKYRICNTQGYCSEATVNVTISDDGCASGQYAPPGAVTSTVSFSTSAQAVDTYLRQDGATTNYGASTSIELGKSPAKTRRFFWAPTGFTTAIPSNAVITDATFRVTQTGGDRGTFTLNTSVYAINQSWNETQATWNIRSTGVNWGTAGGSFQSIPYTSLDLTRSSNGTLHTFPVKSLVEYWQNNRSVASPRPDEMGLMIKQTNEALVDKKLTFGSSENGTASNRPLLTVTYATPLPCTAIPNQPPLANPDEATTTTATAVTLQPRVNDSDMEGSTLTITAVAHVSGLPAAPGSFSFTGTTVIYTPSNNRSLPRTDTLIYTVSDGSLTDQAYIFIRVNNAPPSVNRDNSSGNSGAAQVINLGANDTDAEGATLTNAEITLPPKNGSYTLSANTLTYTPNPGFYGLDTLIYQRCEGQAYGCNPAGLCDTALVVITVLNQPPVVRDTSLAAFACQEININLLQSFSDAEGGFPVVSILSGTTSGNVTTLTYGTLTNTAYGIYVFRPGNQAGTQVIQYRVTDAGGLSSAVGNITITITLPASNRAPVAVDDLFNPGTGEGVGLINQAIYVDVLLNDYDPDGNLLKLQLGAYPGGPALKQPLHGSVSVVNNRIRYVPAFNYAGQDEFEYVIADTITAAGGGCVAPQVKYDIGLVSVRLDAPVQEVPIHISGVVWNDADGSAQGQFTNIFTYNERGVNANNTLYVYLTDASRRVVDLAPVNPDGTYTLAGVPARQSQLRLILSDQLAAYGDAEPVAVLPQGWVATSPVITPDFTTNGVFISGKDWGIEQLPESDDKHDDFAVQLPLPTIYDFFFPLTGSDPEDSPASGSMSAGAQFRITTLPPAAEATLFYDGTAINQPGFLISNYVPAKLKIKFNTMGLATTQFKYATVDAAGLEDPTPATYIIDFAPVTPLAVQGIDLKAWPSGNAVKLEWTSVRENSTSWFMLERSINGIDFEQVAKINRTSVSRLQRYGYTDYPGSGGTVFYRIQEKTMQGDQWLSNVAQVRLQSGTAATQVYPNPAQDAVTVVFGGAEPYSVELLDGSGRRVWKREVPAGVRQYRLERNGLAGGYYLLRILGRQSGTAETFNLVYQQR